MRKINKNSACTDARALAAFGTFSEPVLNRFSASCPVDIWPICYPTEGETITDLGTYVPQTGRRHVHLLLRVPVSLSCGGAALGSSSISLSLSRPISCPNPDPHNTRDSSEWACVGITFAAMKTLVLSAFLMDTSLGQAGEYTATASSSLGSPIYGWLFSVNGWIFAWIIARNSRNQRQNLPTFSDGTP